LIYITFCYLLNTNHSERLNQLYGIISRRRRTVRCSIYALNCASTAGLNYITTPKWGGSKNRNPRNPPKFTKSSVLNGSIVTETCLNQQRQSPTLSGQRTWTVDEIEISSSFNFSNLVTSSLLNACECVDFVSSTGFRGSR